MLLRATFLRASLLRLISVGVFALLAGSALAEDRHSPSAGQFYISPGAVIYEGKDGSRYGYEDHEVGPGIILGYSLSEHWAVEFMAGRTESSFSNRWGSGEDDIDLRWLNVMYKLTGGDDWHPFLLLGAGKTDFNFDGVRGNTSDNQFNAGVGVLAPLTDHLMFRADVRGVASGKGSHFAPMAFVGLTALLGAGTPPAPPADSDGDGVPNDLDKCPTTPAGRTVDASGCELDSDGDGVVDGADRCPATPAGVAVDGRGCAKDSDGDGVPDHRDDCPDSASGSRVNDRGCYIELEEEVTIDMIIEFDTNKAQIRSDHHAEISRATKFLKQYPNTDAVIEGHTDNVGDAGYNQGLSERRAKAVYDYMINEAGVSASRLTWKGFGETQPISENDTAAGRQNNRRVTAVVSGTHKVRQ